MLSSNQSPDGGNQIKNILGPNGLEASKLICHRLPERTFKIKGHYFPVCSRCTGFYLGAFLYFIYVYFFYIEYSAMLVFFAFLMTTPLIIDGTSQLKGLRESNNSLRFITGLIAGLGFAILLKALKWLILVKGGF